jgi:hypothetical protein
MCPLLQDPSLVESGTQKARLARPNKTAYVESY